MHRNGHFWKQNPHHGEEIIDFIQRGDMQPEVATAKMKYWWNHGVVGGCRPEERREYVTVRQLRRRCWVRHLSTKRWTGAILKLNRYRYVDGLAQICGKSIARELQQT